MTDFEIGGTPIGDGHACFVIAEAGINHNGSLETALLMIDAAVDCGADCIKFQTFKAAEFCSGRNDEYEYKSQGKTVRESMRTLFERHEFNETQFRRLFDHARKRGIIAISTPSDDWSVELLAELKTPAYKIGSDDLVYIDFLKKVATKGRPMIVSTGMADAADVERAVLAITNAGAPPLALLHCVSSYPAIPEEMNLRRIPALRKKYGIPVGLSDHSQGTVAATIARALGASIIEKHFTLDKSMQGPDHWFSADVDEMKRLVCDVSTTGAYLGNSVIEPSKKERHMRNLARRSIVSARDLDIGQVLSPDDIAFRRPGTGMMPYDADKILGRTLRAAVVEGEQLSLEQFEAI